MTDRKRNSAVPRWGRFEAAFTSPAAYANAFQDVRLTVYLISPSGATRQAEGFWDGSNTWRFRFSPDETGNWTYTTACSNPNDKGLHDQRGTFECVASSGATRFEQHGPVCLSDDQRYLVHADGTPFFWIGDTAWNGPLRSTMDEWEHYLRERVRQKFTAVQWVATHWLAAPDGDLNGDKAFNDEDKIVLNPRFFQRLDRYVEATARAGLLNVPVLLWAAEWSRPEVNQSNPGFLLPEDQAILLARYMVARWSAYPVAWILPGDSDYRGEKAERWKRIGRGVFGDGPHAPVSLHPGGMQWNGDEFREEPWLDMLGYQSGHGDDENTLDWLVCGPPASDWRNSPPRPFINLEPPYENHLSYQSRTRISPDFTRRALYWSLLVSPTAGVTYGGHGVWGWDDGSAPPVAHPNTGIPLPWREALVMPAAEQVAHLADLFESIEWWRLRPAPELLMSQPGEGERGRYITASKSAEGDLIVVYTPQEGDIPLQLDALGQDLSALWFQPGTGLRQSAARNGGHFHTPGPGDWVLLLGKTILLPAAQGGTP
jgi:hypothetical protein